MKQKERNCIIHAWSDSGYLIDTLPVGVRSRPAPFEKCPEITSVMNWRYTNKIELN